MVNVLATLAALAAIGLLFALDPGGAIAESGFPDFRDMDWKHLTAWGFRLAGVGVALLLVVALWIRYRAPSQGIEAFRDSRYTAMPQPGSMPAAAVSVLEYREVTSRTLLASVIEMCQRGDMRIEATGGRRRSYRYRLSQQGPPKFEWERSICDSLPTRPATVRGLRDRMDAHSDDIGDRLGEYLQGRGLFYDNPVRIRSEQFSDGIGLASLAAVLMGVGSGLWAALWLDQWWANALIGAFIGFTYWLIATPMNTGMLPPSRSGAHTIAQWLGLKESLAGSAPAYGRDESDPMLAYAVALDAAQPWLDAEASAPPWFGSGKAASLRGPDLDAAYRGFLHESAWGLAGRSEDATETDDEMAELLELEWLRHEEAQRTAHRETAAEHGHQRYRVERPVEETVEEAQRTAHRETAAEHGYQRYRVERPVEETVEEPKGGGCLSGCFARLLTWAVIGVVVMVVLFSLDVVSPRAKPCPLDSPPIPTPAQIASLGDLFHNECVRVSGTLTDKDVDTLLLEIDRGDYAQQVVVRVPTGLFEAVSLGKQVALGGWLKVGDGGTYEVEFVPASESERGWWQNLRDNLEGLF